jgi:hypothetical protein
MRIWPEVTGEFRAQLHSNMIAVVRFDSVLAARHEKRVKSRFLVSLGMENKDKKKSKRNCGDR